jgi:hypothetical protein
MPCYSFVRSAAIYFTILPINALSVTAVGAAAKKIKDAQFPRFDLRFWDFLSLFVAI